MVYYYYYFDWSLSLHTFSPFLVSRDFSMYSRSAALMRGWVAGVLYARKCQQMAQNTPTAPANDIQKSVHLPRRSLTSPLKTWLTDRALKAFLYGSVVQCK